MTTKKGMDNNNSSSSSSSSSSNDCDDDVGAFRASYTTKDLILYALSLGFGSNPQQPEQDWRFVHEEHPDFTAVPSFALVLPFWARRQQQQQPIQNSTATTPFFDLPRFPPPMMRFLGVLPRRLLRQNNVDLQEYPIIHAFQSITFHNDLRVPAATAASSRTKQARTRSKVGLPDTAAADVDSGDNDIFVTTLLRSRFVAVVPKSVGTFVTTETTIDEEIMPSGSAVRPLCTVQSTALILGLDEDLVEPWLAPESSSASSHKTSTKWNIKLRKVSMLFEETCTIHPNQALLYRLASGDSNVIHVDPTAVPASFNGAASARPLLHGLCTMGMAARIIWQHHEQQQQHQMVDRHGGRRHWSTRRLQGRFVKPVLVGDTLVVQAWQVKGKDKEFDDHDDHDNSKFWIDFVVRNKTTGEPVLDQGRMVLVSSSSRSRL